MYMDKMLTWSDGKTAVTTTDYLPLGQGDLSTGSSADAKYFGGKTDGIESSNGLILTAVAAVAVAAGLTFDITTADDVDGTNEVIVATVNGPAEAAKPGDILFAVPVPRNCKNYVKVVPSASVQASIFATTVVDKPYPII